MSAKRKTVVGVVFGGRSVEHEVSIVTAQQIMSAFDPERYEVVPVYVSRDGKWFTGAPLRELKNFKDEILSLPGVKSVILSPGTQHHGLIVNPVAGLLSKSEVVRLDVVFPAIHGTHGEDGTLQGLLELADIPYVACPVMASAVANDKITCKALLKQHGIPVVEGISFSRSEWMSNPDAIIERIHKTLTYPLFIKPPTTGSSIGVGRAANETLLRASIEVAAHFDRRVLVESAVTNCVEINCAVLGNGDNIRASVLEQPVFYEELLTFEEKYMRGDEAMKSAERIIPAPISPELTQRIQETAIQAFKAIDGHGIARIDFLAQPEQNQFYLNEMNTMPGSLAFYLWEASGMSKGQLVDELVNLARDAHAEKRRNTYDYQTDLINLTSARGLKGVKGAKMRSVEQPK